jgi:hypothetical protein
VNRYLCPDEIAAIVAAFRYKPGWTLRCHMQPFDDFPYEGFCLDVRLEVPNSYHPQDMQVQNVHVPVPPLLNEAQVIDWLMWRLARVELHELREFGWYKGQIVKDPHASEPSIR